VDLQARDQNRILTVRDVQHVRDRLEPAQREIEPNVILPDLGQLLRDPVRDEPDHHPLEWRQRTIRDPCRAAPAQQTVDHEEREVVTEVDDALLAAAVRDLEDERRTRRRQREQELSEAELLDLEQLELDLAPDPAGQPPL